MESTDNKQDKKQQSKGVTGALWRGAEATWQELTTHPVRSLALTGAAVVIFGVEPLAAVAAVAAIGAAHMLGQRHHDAPA